MDKPTAFDTSDCDEAPEPTICGVCDGTGGTGPNFDRQRPCRACRGKGELCEAADPDGDRNDYYERRADYAEMLADRNADR
jgi:hypothetical protein